MTTHAPDTPAAGPADPAARTCVALAREQARRTPGATAVISVRDGGTHPVTYAELHARADRLAHALRRAGAGRGEPVAVLTARSERTVVGLLGVLGAGAVFLPLTTEYPAERVRVLLADSGCRFVAADHSGRRVIAELGRSAGELAVVDVEQPDGTGTGAEPHPDDLAALLYTSGSTGAPKGVLVEHRSLTWLVTRLHALLYAPLGGRTVEALSAPFVFDAALQQTLSCLANGGTLLVLDEHDRRDPRRFLDLVARHRVGMINVVAPFLGALVDAGLGNGPPSALRHIVTGGQAVPTAVVRRLVDRPAGGSLTVWSMYGPTETTVDATCLRVRRGTVPAGATLGLGTSLPGAVVTVRDDELRVLPPGRRGEICIAGSGVARGYLHPGPDDEARFATDTGTAAPGGRLYRTGDLGRVSATGDLEFLGRRDDQVKVRGHRVEPGEIGNVLTGCRGVAEAVVVPVPDGFGDTDLVAFHTGEEEVDEGALRAHARVHLPPWMVPSRFVRRAALPHTANGKADRAALAAEARAAVGTPDDAAAGPPVAAAPDEHELAALFGTVLGRGPLAPDADFFAEGGHSLKAMRLINRVAVRCGVTVPLRAVLDHPTPRALARALAAAASSAHGGPTGPHLPRAEDAADYPLSYAQQRLWILHQLGGAVAYNVPVVMDQGDLDHAALDAALAVVAERHDSLRTAFTVRDGQPRQVVRDRVALPARAVDVRDAPDPWRAAEDVVRTEAATPFDLAEAPLARVAVIRLPAGRCRLVLTLHHIICDGWSVVVLSRELNAAYRAARRGRPADLPQLPIRYRDFAAWDRTRDLAARAPAWRARLAGAAAYLPLPTDAGDHGRSGAGAFRGGTRAAVLDAELSARLRALAARSGRTPAAVFLALFGGLLHRLTSREDICVGMGAAARVHPDLEHLVGFFTNVLPIRLFPRPDMDFDELAAQASEALATAFDQQDCPIDAIVKDLNPARRAGTQPLTNVMFAFQNFADAFGDAPAPAAEGPADDLCLDQSRLVEIPLDTAKFDLTLYVHDTPAGFRTAFEYDGGLFRPETVDRYLRALERLARAVTTGEDRA